MNVSDKRTAAPNGLLGIDCGGTRSVAILASMEGALRERIEAPGANLRLESDADLARHFNLLACRVPAPCAIGIGMAGARGEDDTARILRILAGVWPGVPCSAHHDLETALAALGPWTNCGVRARVVVLSGTGSCCFGGTDDERRAKIGGWGHMLGDKGSGFEIGMRALRAVVFYLDRDGVWSGLGQRILRTLQLSEPEQLIAWVQGASKAEIARLAIEVFAAQAQGDRIARDILEGAASTLASDAVACAARLVRRGAPVEFVLSGSVLLRQRGFAARVASRIRAAWPTARIHRQRREAAWGGIELARRLLQRAGGENSPEHAPPPPAAANRTRSKPALAASAPPVPALWIPGPTAVSPTERRNPRSRRLDRMDLPNAVQVMLTEERCIQRALSGQSPAIVRAIRLIVSRLRRGGRLFYLGAGTSGRLAVLDASECPPTFRTPADLVQGVIAGGPTALWSAVEGAEDDFEAGRRAVSYRGVGPRDVVVGIAASGRTPWVWGGLAEARTLRAATVLLTFNPHLRFSRGRRPDVVIAADVGPEVLTGSTRLKAGTATKLVLNMLTTLTMVRLGRVVENLMVDLHPSNRKLRERAVRIVCTLAKVEPDEATAALRRSSWVVKRALTALRRRPAAVTSRSGPRAPRARRNVPAH